MIAEQGLSNRQRIYPSFTYEQYRYPWHLYLKKCLRSDNWSMINRERIWTIAKIIHQNLLQGEWLA